MCYLWLISLPSSRAPYAYIASIYQLFASRVNAWLPILPAGFLHLDDVYGARVIVKPNGHHGVEVFTVRGKKTKQKQKVGVERE